MVAALVSACGLEPIDGDDGGQTGTMPEEVRTAMDETCGKAKCHSGSAPDAGLDLTYDNAPNILGATSKQSGLPYVRIGDTKGSYIALKMQSKEILANIGADRSGSIMPPAVAKEEGDDENISLILAWIAGAQVGTPSPP